MEFKYHFPKTLHTMVVEYELQHLCEHCRYGFPYSIAHIPENKDRIAKIFPYSFQEWNALFAVFWRDDLAYMVIPLDLSFAMNTI
ncbi:MAG: hypothetical protein ACYCSO_00765 [Cuniculiplasma sp.]